MLATPPFGVKWEAQQAFIRREHEEQGFGGRFGAGLPRINDGSLLFLLHMISKRKDPKEGGTRLAIVFNGSPLFTGSAGSGESEIRRWIIENDWLEGVVALPDQLFYNTGIYTYLWIVTNRKERRRRGKVQLLNAASFFKKMRKSLGNKRQEICEPQRDDRLLRAGAAAHRLDDEEAAADAHHLFTDAGGRGAADAAVAVEAGADDRRIPHAPGELPGEPARGTAGDHAAVLGEDDHADGVVVALIGAGLARLRLLLPPAPFPNLGDAIG
jgi:hypothetical protein